MGGVGPSWIEQDEQLRKMWKDNIPPEDIADKLQRTVAAVMTRAARLGLPRRFAPGRKPLGQGSSTPPRRRPPPQPKIPTDDPNVKLRRCLMCTTEFHSAGAHNRICPRCKETPDYDAANRLPDMGIAY